MRSTPSTMVIGSPMRTRLSASFLSLAPMSTKRSSSFAPLVRSSGRRGVDRPPADDAQHRAVLGVHVDALAPVLQRVGPADARHPDEALVVHVAHHQADLVHVAGEHQAQAAFGVEHEPLVAVDVALDFVRVLRDALAHHRLQARLEARRRGRGEHGFQQSERLF